MKRLLVALIGCALLGGGLVAVSTSSSVAGGGPYPGTAFTACDIGGRQSLPNKKPRPKSQSHIRSAGSGRPVGKLVVRYTKSKGNYKSNQTVKYNTKFVKFTGPKLKKLGRYKVQMKFVPKSGSVWKSCGDNYYITRVKK